MTIVRTVISAFTLWAIFVSLTSAQAQDTTKADSSDTLRCPSARGYAAMVYDESASIAYLFGGIDKTSPNLDYPLFDLWSYHSLTQRWKLLCNSDTLYNVFQRDAAAIDPQSKQIVLFSTFVNCKGSSAESCGVETWIYDIRPNTFTNVTSGTEPALRWGSRMAYEQSLIVPSCSAARTD